MQQFFSLRFWATLGMLLVLVLGVVVLAARSNPGEPLSAPEVIPRRIDTGAVVQRFRPDPGWGMRNDATVGSLNVDVDDGRTFLVGEGTPGVIECEDLDVRSSCTFLAELLGEAVVWFAVIPSEPGRRVTLPGVVAVLDEGRKARLENGWIVPLVDVVRRECTTVETANFRDFVARVGADSVSVYDLVVDEVSTVICLTD